MGPIGVFDSGYGGLTILKEIVNILPQYDYLYLGDNARAPYGSRSYETVYAYTLEAVQWFFAHNCPLVILACNTASAKALKTIQQNDIKNRYGNKRVLGVIRPTSEKIGALTHTGKVGVLGTTGTVRSESYILEIAKFYPLVQVFQEACPMWVPLIENMEHCNAGADYFIEKNLKSLLQKNTDIDTILLACTHYPLIQQKIETLLPTGINVIAQGTIVADSLRDYLQRHIEMDSQCSKHGTLQFYTTDAIEEFNKLGSIFFGREVYAQHADL